MQEIRPNTREKFDEIMESLKASEARASQEVDFSSGIAQRIEMMEKAYSDIGHFDGCALGAYSSDQKQAHQFVVASAIHGFLKKTGNYEFFVRGDNEIYNPFADPETDWEAGMWLLEASPASLDTRLMYVYEPSEDLEGWQICLMALGRDFRRSRFPTREVAERKAAHAEQ